MPTARENRLALEEAEEIRASIRASGFDDTDDLLAELSPTDLAEMAKWWLNTSPDAPSAWVVREKGDARWGVCGWGLWAEDGWEDLDELTYTLLYGPRDPTTGRRGKIDTNPHPHQTATLLYPKKPVEKITSEQRSARAKEVAEKKARPLMDALLAAVSSGAPIAAALDTLAISQNRFRQWKSRYPDFAPRLEAARHTADIEEARWSHDGTFASWRRHYTGYRNYAHHSQIIEAIESCPPGQLTMILVPPEAGKTTLLEDYITYLTCEDPNHRTLVVSEADGHARKILSTIKERLTNAEDIDLLTSTTDQPSRFREMVARYGPFRDEIEDKSRPWNQNFIKVHKAVGHRDYTVQAVGWNAGVYGARCDLLLMDDMQSHKSLAQTEQMIGRLSNTFFSRPGKDGKLIYIGTRVGMGDLPERLIKDGVVSRLVQIPALDAEGNSYCPEMWPLDALLGELDPKTGERTGGKMKLVRKDGWWTTYMLQPQRAGDGTFTEEDIARCSDVTLGTRAPRLSDGEMFKIATSIDPALGGGTAFVTAAWNADTFRLVDARAEYGLARNEDIFGHAKRHIVTHRSVELVVERNALQRGIARDQRLRDMGMTLGFSIVEHETSSNKWDPMFGISAMVSSFLDRSFVIPDNENAHERLGEWREQFLAWRPNLPPKLLRQDLVMATWFLWMRWKKETEEMDIDVDAWGVGGTPWVPGDLGAAWGNGGSMGYLERTAG